MCMACINMRLPHAVIYVLGRQASNLLRSFRTIPEATKLGLILNDNDPGLHAWSACVALGEYNIHWI